MFTGAMSLSGCSKPPAPKPEKLTAHVDRGPFKFDVAVWPTKPQVGDVIQLDMTAHTPDDSAVEFPGGDALKSFDVLSTKDDDPKPAADGGLDWRRHVEMESYASGETEIPPLSMKYGPRPDDDKQKLDAENELVTDSIKLTVRSALTSQDSVMAPRDITGTLMPPRAPLSAWQWTILIASILAGLAAIAAGVWWLYRIAHRPAPPIPAEVIARQALAELAGADWLEPQRIRECHYRLSEIVRVYIENKFGLGAPEMTTEEFIRALAARSSAAIPPGFVRKLPDHQRRLDPRDDAEPLDALPILRSQSDSLRAFLEACDMVKYGAMTPERDAALQTIETARVFVALTSAEIERRQVSANKPQATGGRAA